MEGEYLAVSARRLALTTLSVLLVKRASLLAIRGFDEENPSTQDYVICLALAETSHHFVAVDEALVIKHEYEAAQMSENSIVRVSIGEMLNRRWGAVIERYLGWRGYRRWERKRWESV